MDAAVEESDADFADMVVTALEEDADAVESDVEAAVEDVEDGVVGADTADAVAAEDTDVAAVDAVDVEPVDAINSVEAPVAIDNPFSFYFPLIINQL